ncbi:MAG: redoxin family protein [Clostridia bacterium]|nr:redoxin family protein [Clostridia bacterium]
MKTGWWQAHRPTTRRLVQLYSALLHNAYIKGFIDGKIYAGSAKFACVPGFNCYSCPGAVGSCPLGALQNALASAGHRAGWYVLGILLLFGVTLGRTICGWLCPLGLIQELLHRIPTPKLRKSRVTRALSWLKYVILAVFVIALPLGYGLRYRIPMPAFCKYICPAGTVEGAMGLLANPANASYYGMLGLLFTRKFVIMLVIGLACVFCYRSFCRFVCPLGAIYGLFNRFTVLGVKVDANRCNRCGACVRHCGMDVRRVGDRECIHCGKCMDVCNQGAISIKAGRITLKAPETGCAGEASDAPARRRRLGRILWGAALAVLCFALVWFNFLDPAARNDVRQEQAAAATEAPVAPLETETPVSAEAPVDTEVPAVVSYDSDAPIGHEVGQQLEDFTLECYDGSEFHLADMRGKAVFINLWATYCTPCVHELPYFSELYAAHEGDIAVIAVHSRLVTMDPVAFLADKGCAMPFATDTDDVVNTIVGGTGTLPQTVVLNRRGEVVYNQVGSVTPEILASLYDEAEE